MVIFYIIELIINGRNIVMILGPDDNEPVSGYVVANDGTMVSYDGVDRTEQEAIQEVVEYNKEKE
jgi:hypothetical protein